MLDRVLRINCTIFREIRFAVWVGGEGWRQASGRVLMVIVVANLPGIVGWKAVSAGRAGGDWAVVVTQYRRPPLPDSGMVAPSILEPWRKPGFKRLPREKQNEKIFQVWRAVCCPVLTCTGRHLLYAVGVPTCLCRQ